MIESLLLLSFTGIAVWRLRRRRLANVRANAIESGLAFTVDLVAVVMGSGGTVSQAVRTVANHGPAPIRPAFQRVIARSTGGALLADALSMASEDLGPAYHPLIGALITTERDGAPVSLLLQRLADDAEHARRWRGEALATRLPVSLLVPLVVCLLPAGILAAVVPLATIALRQLAS